MIDFVVTITRKGVAQETTTAIIGTHRCANMIKEVNAKQVSSSISVQETKVKDAQRDTISDKDQKGRTIKFTGPITT